MLQFEGWTYNEKGELFRPSGKRCSLSTGGHDYRRVSINGKRYYQHRIVFFLHTGLWPDIVDHINRDTTDNRPSNLRAADAYTNQQNQGIGTANTSGVLGVTLHASGNLWVAYFTAFGKSKTRYFKDKESAILQRKA
jgi:hypothetical protein